MHIYAEYGKSQSVFIQQEDSEARETDSTGTQDNRLQANEASTSRTNDYMAIESKFQWELNLKEF